MKIAGIVCEYNPFHNGHKYQIEQTKKQFGATHIVCVMSGNFTQRGDVAVADKYERAKVALENGADLVIELPVAFSLATAEYFARGAVYLLNALSCVDIISFGSENGDINKLTESAAASEFAIESDELADFMRKGMSYPAALKKTIDLFYSSDVSDVLTKPNNTLAVEYIKAIELFHSDIIPCTIMRSGASHDSEEDAEMICASRLRKMLRTGHNTEKYMPKPDFSDIADIKNLETAILAKLRTMSKEDFKRVPNVTNGMENRIFSAVREASSLAHLLLLIKSKNFTMARIRRIILCAFLGITKNDLKKYPSYVKILGMNSKGKEILSVSKNCHLPIDTSLSALSKKSELAEKQAMIEEKAGNMYALSFNNKRPCGSEYTAKPVILP